MKLNRRFKSFDGIAPTPADGMGSGAQWNLFVDEDDGKHADKAQASLRHSFVRRFKSADEDPLQNMSGSAEGDTMEFLKQVKLVGKIQNWEVEQTHIKKAPKLIQLVVGEMGVTLIDKAGKPLQTHIYASLKNWSDGMPGMLGLFPKDPKTMEHRKGARGKVITLVTEDASTICALMTKMQRALNAATKPVAKNSASARSASAVSKHASGGASGAATKKAVPIAYVRNFTSDPGEHFNAPFNISAAPPPP